MIHLQFTKGDMLAATHEAVVNTVNCKGKMGRGLALQFKKRFPKMFLNYKRYCDEGRLKPGDMHVYQSDESPKWIVNFPTKDHWRNPSKMEYITTGLKSLIDFLKKEHITDIAIPPLGCGLGGLHWYQVRAEIKKAFDAWAPDYDVRVTVYEP